MTREPTQEPRSYTGDIAHTILGSLNRVAQPYSDTSVNAEDPRVRRSHNTVTQSLYTDHNDPNSTSFTLGITGISTYLESPRALIEHTVR
ncbi:hypothetical protein FKM82_015181 [Ascaphus truei]